MINATTITTGNPALDHWLASDGDECFIVDVITDADYPTIIAAPDDPGVTYPPCPHCDSGMVAPTDWHELTCPTCGCVYEEDEDDGTLTITTPGKIKPFVPSELGELL